MKRLPAIAIAAICLATSGAQAAAPTPAAPAAAATPSPKALALTQRYIAALHMKDSFKPMMNGLLSSMVQQQIASNPKLTAEQGMTIKQAVTEAFNESLEAGLLDKMMNAMIPSMATVFTEDELQALVDFYESPKGQAIIAKMPEFGQVAGVEMSKFMPEMQADLQKRMFEKLQPLLNKPK